MRYLTDLPLIKNKRVLVRVDFNVPIKAGVITDESRLLASLPTIRFLQKKGAKIILLSHRKNPQGKVVEDLRLQEVGSQLSKILGTKIFLAQDCLGMKVQQQIQSLPAGGILLLENVRFHAGELTNDSKFAQELAGLADFFIFDAFGVIHRRHASTVGLAKLLPSFVGKLVEAELKFLGSALVNPPRPLVLVLGGAKIATKIGVIKRFSQLADFILLGGGIANTFLAAQGVGLGASLYEPEKLALAREILQQDQVQQAVLRLPQDVTLFPQNFGPQSLGRNYSLNLPGLKAQAALPADCKILDLGKATQQDFQVKIAQAKLVIWNGPVGLFELPGAAQGTQVIAEACQKSAARTILGGGDTLAALKQFQIESQNFTHLSTGGGAMLKFLEGEDLPVLTALSGCGCAAVG